jgi:hypothetical protein
VLYGTRVGQRIQPFQGAERPRQEYMKPISYVSCSSAKFSLESVAEGSGWQLSTAVSVRIKVGVSAGSKSALNGVRWGQLHSIS